MSKLTTVITFIAATTFAFVVGTQVLFAQTTPARRFLATPTPAPTVSPSPEAKLPLTEKSDQTATELEKLLSSQIPGNVWTNPLKYAIRNAVAAGVPANTIVLLLLLPFVASVIATTRHLIGVRGFGIFLPAALSIVFVATGPIVGVGLFLIIAFISFVIRTLLKKFKIRLQYLPRMAFILWSVSVGVLGILFLSPLVNLPSLTNVSIFPVLLLALLAEDFTRVQLGKSFKTASSLTIETLILALVSFTFLTFFPLQRLALLHPEAWLVSIALFNYIIGRYAGLRLLELWRFRKLIKG